MKKNVGSADMTIRLAIATIIAILIILGVFPLLIDIILGIIGAIMLVTSFLGICGIYAILGINTCETEDKK